MHDARITAARFGSTQGAAMLLRKIVDHLSPRFGEVRAKLVRRGVEFFCGASKFNLAPTVAADIPLVRAGIGMLWLRALARVGVKTVVASSGLGHRFVCHIGDLAEHPFYHRAAYRKELELCAAWLAQEPEPVMYDVGANDGFFSSQIAQMIGDPLIRIYAFEPVPHTFAKLVETVCRLRLGHRVHPIGAAVIDGQGIVRLSFSDKNSLYAQVTTDGLNSRAGDELVIAPAVTLDEFYSVVTDRPALIKIDVEGSEAAVLRGASSLLSGPDRPALALEFSPFTMRELGESPSSVRGLLSGYTLFYVDDLEGQRLPFGHPLESLEEVSWTCNLFAVPVSKGASARWEASIETARHRVGAPK